MLSVFYQKQPNSAQQKERDILTSHCCCTRNSDKRRYEVIQEHDQLEELTNQLEELTNQLEELTNQLEELTNQLTKSINREQLTKIIYFDSIRDQFGCLYLMFITYIFNDCHLSSLSGDDRCCSLFKDWAIDSHLLPGEFYWPDHLLGCRCCVQQRVNYRNLTRLDNIGFFSCFTQKMNIYCKGSNICWT